MKTTTTPPLNKMRQRFRTDIHFWILVVLALITVPRIFIHDLDLLSLDSPIYKILSTSPLLLYFGIAVLRNNKRPFYDFMVLGILFGMFLAIAHQITWNASWGDNPPELGGNLSNVSPTIEGLIVRIAGVGSSIMTGLMVGVVFGTIALAARWIRRSVFHRSY